MSLHVMSDEQYDALTRIITERMLQDKKWGVQNHGPRNWLVILMEEVGEAAKASLENEGEEYKKELVQVAAVALAALECADRQEQENNL